MVSIPDNGRAVRTALRAFVASADPDGDGLYLTNEVFLYRVVGVAASDIGDMVELEDCYSLDSALVPIVRVRACRLRVVIAPPGPSGWVPRTG
jgi:hypothetical protein